MLERKINISVDAVHNLISEVERNRSRLQVVEAENKVMNNFFSMVNRLGGQPGQGYSEDLFVRSKKEFEAAILEMESK